MSDTERLEAATEGCAETRRLRDGIQALVDAAEAPNGGGLVLASELRSLLSQDPT